MRKRHWQQIAQLLPIDLSLLSEYCIDRLLKLGALEISEQLASIGERADKEFKIEKMLKELDEKWE